MSRRRAHAGELAKLLDSFSQPLYVLDDSLAIVYLNEACRAWLGEGSEELLGQPCTYQSGEAKSPLALLAAGLCPPPAVLEGRELTADVSSPSSERPFQSARFVPLSSAQGQVLFVIALVDPRDTSSPPEDGLRQSDDAQEFHLHLQRFHQWRRLRRSVTIVGVSPAARRAAAQAELAAATKVNVLLVGPAGSGRRRLAEAIHYGGSREKGDSPIFDDPLRGYPAKIGTAPALVPLDCALLDADLMQSTLRAAASAHDRGGSLLLCEVDCLAADAQAALAASIASPRFAWRAIATAAAPLDGLVARGLFRGDLAAALSTLAIELPPLSTRRDDLPLLAQAMLEERNAGGGKQLGGFSPEALDLLSAYSWPGNLAELDQAVAECHQCAAGTHVVSGDLPERLRVAAEASARPRRKEEPIQLDEFLARVERELIGRALSRSKGNKAKAARLLGLTRPRLYRRMVQLGLIESESPE